MEDEMRYRMYKGDLIGKHPVPPISFETLHYDKQQENLPEKGEHFTAYEKDDLITFYAAFNRQIADFAVANQQFGGNAFSFTRMTWIKPGFMWMMYRSSWATAENQERILALKIPKIFVKEILQQAVPTTFIPEKFESHAAWKKALGESDVRVQWDPDHDINGGKMTRKQIQLGLKGEMLQRLNNEFIKEIEDITAFVAIQRINASIHKYPNLEIPVERVLEDLW